MILISLLSGAISCLALCWIFYFCCSYNFLYNFFFYNFCYIICYIMVRWCGEQCRRSSSSNTRLSKNSFIAATQTPSFPWTSPSMTSWPTSVTSLSPTSAEIIKKNSLLGHISLPKKHIFFRMRLFLLTSVTFDISCLFKFLQKMIATIFS